MEDVKNNSETKKISDEIIYQLKKYFNESFVGNTNQIELLKRILRDNNDNLLSETQKLLSGTNDKLLSEINKTMLSNNNQLLSTIKNIIAESLDTKLKELFSKIDTMLIEVHKNNQLVECNNKMLKDMTKKLDVEILTNELTYVATNTKFYNKKLSTERICSIKEELQNIACNK